MTDAESVLFDLLARGIRLSVHGSRLRIDAPTSGITDQVRGAARQHKAALIRILEARPFACRHCGRMIEPAVEEASGRRRKIMVDYELPHSWRTHRCGEART